METKELKVQAPDGYEIDKENSTFERIKFKPKMLTYEDIARKLSSTKKIYGLGVDGCIFSAIRFSYPKGLYAASKKQLEKLVAINELMNVAKILNYGWKADPENISEEKFYFYISSIGSVEIAKSHLCIGAICYFKNEESANTAIDILGEDTIRLALSTDW